MKPIIAKLIHKSYITFLRTQYPVHFYGLPDNRIYLFYAQPCESDSWETRVEFVFAVHKDFSYNYSEERIIPKAVFRAPVYNEMVDNPDPNIEITEICRDVKSYTQAVAHLNQLADQLSRKKQVVLPKPAPVIQAGV